MGPHRRNENLIIWGPLLEQFRTLLDSIWAFLEHVKERDESLGKVQYSGQYSDKFSGLHERIDRIFYDLSIPLDHYGSTMQSSESPLSSTSDVAASSSPPATPTTTSSGPSSTPNWYLTDSQAASIEYQDFWPRKANEAPRARCFASGGFSEVFKVNYLGRTRVTKEFKAIEFSNHKTAEEREKNITSFCEEATRLSRLIHPNVVKFLGARAIFDGIGGSNPFLLLEYLPESFEKIIHPVKGPCLLSTEHILDLFSQVASALNYLHSSNPCVVHRDLKPQNIMLPVGLKV
jgi:hypothetical protein